MGGGEKKRKASVLNWRKRNGTARGTGGGEGVGKGFFFLHKTGKQCSFKSQQESFISHSGAMQCTQLAPNTKLELTGWEMNAIKSPHFFQTSKESVCVFSSFPKLIFVLILTCLKTKTKTGSILAEASIRHF